MTGALYAVIAIIAALDYRRRTGKGQCIDLSQFESGVGLLTTAILDYVANQRVQSRMGNRSPFAAPHGVYRCKGDDRWCAITIFTDQEWNAFCDIIGRPQWTKEPKFATLLARKENEDELDKLVEEWTANRTAEEVTTSMQTSGIAVGVLKNASDMMEDPQIQHRRHLRISEHPEIGPHTCEVPAFILSKTPCQMNMPAPCLGQHNEYVYTKVLGISDEEFVDLLTEGVFD
jgi:benzylsuccinate CoA-transferase BbsF subunit